MNPRDLGSCIDRGVFSGIEVGSAFGYIHWMSLSGKSQRWMVLIGCSSLLLLASGCAERKKILTVAISAMPTQIDPVLSIDLDIARIASNLFESLFELTEQDSIEPCLAAGWEYNDERTALTIHLRDDVLFHDGSPLTAEDVVFSLTRVTAGDDDSEISTWMSADLFGNPLSIRATGPLTVEILLP